MRGPFAVMVPAALRYRGWETSVTSSPVSDAACPIRVVCSATLPPVRRPASSMPCFNFSSGRGFATPLIVSMTCPSPLRRDAIGAGAFLLPVSLSACRCR